MWHALSDSDGRDELWQVFVGDSHALRTSARATPVVEKGRNFRFFALEADVLADFGRKLWTVFKLIRNGSDARSFPCDFERQNNIQ